jgi:hypothetical protein
MPEKRVMERVQKDRAAGKSASTQAGEFVREQIHKIRRGEHGARSAKQAIAIGLSQARRAGVELKPPRKGRASEKSRNNARRAYAVGHGAPLKSRHSAKRVRAIKRALRREGHAAASHEALSRHAKSAAAHRTATERGAATQKAVHTKGHAGLVAAAQKAARTRARAA